MGLACIVDCDVDHDDDRIVDSGCLVRAERAQSEMNSSHIVSPTTLKKV